MRMPARQGLIARAESCFGRALEIARKQRAKSLELRATMSSARLLAKHGRRDEARTIARRNLRLVHRRFRYCGPERGEVPTRRTGHVAEALNHCWILGSRPLLVPSLYCITSGYAEHD